MLESLILLPQERLKKFGPESLSVEELLYIISGKKFTKHIISNIGKYSTYDLAKLFTVKDLNEDTAIFLGALYNLAKRLLYENKGNDSVTISSPQEVFSLIREHLVNLNKECLYLISLNSRKKVLAVDLISVGTLDQCMLHPREILKTALHRNAASIVIAHNHPSNDLTPSDEDVSATTRLMLVCKYMGVSLLDHLIVSLDGYASLKAQGCLKVPAEGRCKDATTK